MKAAEVLRFRSYKNMDPTFPIMQYDSTCKNQTPIHNTGFLVKTLCFFTPLTDINSMSNL